MNPEPSKPARRRPIAEGCRVRHILGAEALAVRVEGNQVFVLWEGAEREKLLLMGFIEAIPGEFT
jgi:hypothetical protein